MSIQLPNDVMNKGYVEIRPFHHEQVFYSPSLNFTGTKHQFLAAGHGYEYIQVDQYRRFVVDNKICEVK